MSEYQTYPSRELVKKIDEFQVRQKIRLQKRNEEFLRWYVPRYAAQTKDRS